MEVWQRAAASGADIETTERGTVIRINVGDGQPRLAVPVEDIDPAVVSLVSQRNALVKAMTENKKLASSLDERHRQLAERFPEQEEAIEADRAKDSKAIQEAWARIAEPSKGW